MTIVLPALLFVLLIAAIPELVKWARHEVGLYARARQIRRR